MRTRQPRLALRSPRQAAAAALPFLVIAAAASVAPAQSRAGGQHQSGTSPDHALVRGVVVDDGTGAPVALAAVMLLDDTGELVAKIGRTDSGGYFELRAPAAGRYRVLLRRNGYTSLVSSGIDVEAGESIELDLPLAASGGPTSAAMIVGRESIERVHWIPDAFARRRAERQGTFVGPRELRRTRPLPVGVLLARLGWSGGAGGSAADRPDAAPARLVAHAGGRSEIACDAQFRLNGEPIDPAEVNVLALSTAELRAVELHRGGAVPPELAGRPGCDVIVLWIR